MGKREYLKHKSYEDYPMRLSMRRSAKWKNCNWVPGIWRHSSKLHMMYVKIDKFLKSRVGKKYDDVYSEFRRKFPAYYGGRDLVELFKESFMEHQNHHWNGKYSSFYVDNGIIKDGYVKNKRNKEVKINIQKNESTYIFNKETLKDKRVRCIVDFYLPHKYKYYLHCDIPFSEKVRQSMIFYLTISDTIYDELTALHSKKWWKNKYGFGWNGYYSWWGNKIDKETLKRFLFTEINNNTYDIVKLGSKEFIRNYEDSRKSNASRKRLAAKEEEIKREFMLHDLLQTRKKKEKEENELIRDRHGFNDHSFKNW